MIFRQKTDNVTKTDHLDNYFELVAACKTTVENSSVLICSASGGLLSLSDYNNNADIDSCLAEGCEF